MTEERRKAIEELEHDMKIADAMRNNYVVLHKAQAKAILKLLKEKEKE